MVYENLFDFEFLNGFIFNFKIITISIIMGNNKSFLIKKYLNNNLMSGQEKKLLTKQTGRTSVNCCFLF